MSLGMQLSFSQSQSQELSLQQACIANFSTPMKNLFLRLFDPANTDNEDKRKMLATTISSGTHSNDIKKICYNLLNDQLFRICNDQYCSRIIKDKDLHLTTNIATNYIYSLLEDNRKDKGDYIRVLHEYIFERDKFKYSKKVALDQIKTNKNIQLLATHALYQEVQNTCSKDICTIAQNMDTVIKSLYQNEYFTTYLKEKILIENSCNDIGEKILERFIERSNVMSTYFSPETFKISIMNTIAESILVSLGVVGPELFIRKKAFLSNKTSQDIANTLDMGMSEFGNLQEQYGLQKGPAIFFYRRATEYGNCTAKKHEEIRNFITSTVRKKSPIYLSKIPITEIIQKLKTIKGSKGVSKLEKYEQYSAILVEDVFNEHLRTEIQNDVSGPLFGSIQKIVSTG